MTEGFGLYAGNVYGDGQRAHYGFASSLTMIEPVGASSVRVLAGDRAAMAFNKNGAHTQITDYRCSSPGNVSFTLRSALPSFDLSLTVPYVDISARPVTLIRDGQTLPLTAGRDFTRPPQALWSLYLRGVRNGDRVIIGAPDEKGPVLPSRPPLVEAGESELLARVVSGGNKSPHRPGVHSSPAMGPLFHSTSIFMPMIRPYDSRPDENWDHLSSWAGLQRSWFWAYGIRFWLAPLGSKSEVSRFTKIAVQSLSSVALLYTPGDGPPPSVVFADGTRAAVDTRMEALAWRNWPPIYTSKLLVTLVMTNGKAVAGIDPGGRTVWAVSASFPNGSNLRGSGGIQNILSLLKQGNAEWKRMEAEEEIVRRVAVAGGALPQNSIAILPPAGSGPAANFVDRAGISEHAQTLTPDQVVDPQQFNAHRFGAALFAGAETYVNTVHAAGDAGDAVVRFVQEGGTLLLLSSEPWPMYYPRGPGETPGPADPLTLRLGLPLYNALETDPEEHIAVAMSPGQTVLRDVPLSLPYPPGDPRLRSIDRKALPAGARYTPIYTVRSQSGKDYGDAAGLVELPGGGRMLYIWAGLTRDPINGARITAAAMQFLIKAATRDAHVP